MTMQAPAAARFKPKAPQNPHVHSDNALETFGDDNDAVIVLNSAGLGADEELTGVIEGTSDHPGTAANSLIISNITDDGDILFLISKGGDSNAFLWADGSTGDTALMAASGQSVDIYIAGTKEIDYATGALAFQQATTISTTTGNLSIDAAASAVLVINEAGVDADFRIESDNLPNMFAIDAADDAIGIGAAPSALRFLNITPPNNTGDRTDGYGLMIYGFTYTDNETAASGTGGAARFYNFEAPTLAATNANVTTTDAATMRIAGAPTAGANMTFTREFAFWVDAGAVRLDGSLFVESSPTEGSAGEQLTSGGAGAVMTWGAAASLAMFKNTIGELSPEEALRKIVSWHPKLFRYRPDAEMSTHDFETVYTAVYGDEAPEVMHHEGRIFSPTSAFGYSVGAIQALQKELATLRVRLATLEVK